MKPYIYFSSVIIISLACSSATAIPTHIPIANQSPLYTPQPTLIPGTLECSDILSAHEGMSDSEWEEYKSKIKGKEIYFWGYLGKVFPHGDVAIDSGISMGNCGFQISGVPQEISSRPTTENQVKGYGTILDINWFVITPVIYIKVNLDSLNLD
jgi:hypothetical protein